MPFRNATAGLSATQSADAANRHAPADPNRFSPGRRRAMIAVLLAAACFNGFDTLLMNVALASVSRAYAVTLDLANWLVVGFTVLAAVTVTCAARVIERIGLKAIVAVAGAFMAAGSLIGLLAGNFWVMFAARLVQSVSAGLLYPTVNTAIVRIAPPGREATLLSVDTAVIGIGTAIGPLAAGLVLGRWGLNAVFAPTLLMGAAIALAALFVLVPLDKPEPKPVDVPSVVLSLAGLSLFMLGLSQITAHVAPAAVATALGAGVIWLFCRRQKRITVPLLDLSPLAVKGFSAGIGLNTMGNVAEQAVLLLVPLYLEETAGMSALVAGAAILVPELAFSGLCVLAGRIEDKHGIWPMVPLGFALVTLGFAAMAWVPAGAGTLAMALLTLAVLVGCAFCCAPDKARGLESLPKDVVDNGSSINSTLARLAQSLASALFVGVLSATARGSLAAGASHAAAYAAGFDRTALIAAVMEGAALLVAVRFARWAQRQRKARG